LSHELFTEADVRQIEAEGLTVEKVLSQIDIFTEGTSPVILNRPCKIGDGIVRIAVENMPEVIALCEQAMQAGRVLKFVPASGAATRMFKDWYRILEKDDIADKKEGIRFTENLARYAFFEDLKQVIDANKDNLEELIKAKRYTDIIEYILTAKGMKYGSMPKAMLKFHQYPDETRTALEEHLVEGILYARDASHICRIHLTVSEEHKDMVNKYLSEIKGKYESRYGVHIEVVLSTQQTSTNTISMGMDNRPFRDDAGRLFFRPGGHGALLKNFNAIDGDIIFLKNIDNVVPDRMKSEVVHYKKVIGGYLVKIQDLIFHYLHLLESKEVDENTIKEISSFCGSMLYITMPPKFDKLALTEKSAFFFKKLNRPIRVCGMVRNEGEPGGGPFWVEGRDDRGPLSLQIVEESQIDQGSADQKAIWKDATHFNPVDIVCGVRDYRNRKFDLQEFVDDHTFFISNKFEKGRAIKTLEYPGLWNGSMAFWNTIFVEVPTDTFHPVKMVEDLLRPQHLNNEG